MNDIKQKLSNAGLRATRGRILVLQILKNNIQPHAHQDIMAQIAKSPQAEAANIDRVTLYRMLDAFVEASLVHRVQGTDATWRYCYNDEENNGCPGGHPHLLCEACGMMTCLREHRLERIQTPNDFHISHKQMLILGLCDPCFKAKSSTQKTPKD